MQTRTEQYDEMKVGSNKSRILAYVKKPLLAISLLLVTDMLILLVTVGSIPRPTLTLLLFFEGGTGLIAGAAIALSSTPSISKFGELTFGTAAWSRESEKHAEKIGWKWIFTGTLLVLIAFLVSSV